MPSATTPKRYPLLGPLDRLDKIIDEVRHDRVGRCGRRFKLIKFRSMRPAERAADVVVDDGHRVTRVGRWLRKFRLDEIPQFVNILRGDMNLVGPRPHRVPKFELFVEQIPYFWLRFTIRPGLTGWAQTRYAYAQTLEEETEKVRYDLYYLKHMSFWLDVRILVDTIKIVLLSRGSAGAPRRETVVLRGLKRALFPRDASWHPRRDATRLTGVVTVADDGGSSGRLRR